LQGKVYLQKDPGLRIRVVGQAPIASKVYELERLRCNVSLRQRCLTPRS
jgi:hypothetical protein